MKRQHQHRSLPRYESPVCLLTFHRHPENLQLHNSCQAEWCVAKLALALRNRRVNRQPPVWRVRRSIDAYRFHEVRLEPVWQAAICAPRSPSRSSGVRTLLRRIANTSPTIFSALHELYRRNAKAFLEDFAAGPHRSGIHSPHIRVMGAGSHVEVGRARMEARFRTAKKDPALPARDVGQVCSAAEGIVQHHDVAWFKCALRDRGCNRHRHWSLSEPACDRP